ncbi:MAG: restriction endonuclease subunit S [Pseudomonadota bacterium]
MKSNFKRLGDYIQLVDTRNTDFKIDRLLGMNISKNFIPSVANVSETDLSKYKVIRKDQFAYSAMQVGRDETVRVALFTEQEPAIISPAYLVFEVIDSNIVLPEFLMMWFQRPESDRYGWFISDGSVRSSLEWERFCEILVPIPDDIEEQKNCVSIYNGLLSNQQCYERSLNDLQLICDSYMETLALKEGTKVLGDYIQPVDIRNSDLKVKHLRGVSTSKQLIEFVANTNGLDFSKYKIVNSGQFVYVADTSRRGDKIALAMNELEPCIVSSIYTVFELKEQSDLFPEFLFLWFKRKEFDRYARFHSWGSARETFDWNDMCEVKLPIPDIDVQKSIVAIHHTLETRKRINERLKSLVTPLCLVLIKGVVNKINDAVKEKGVVLEVGSN